MQTSLSPSVCRAFLGCQIEKAVDELNLTKKIISCHPLNLSLPDHVDCCVALNRSPSRLEFSEALLGHPGQAQNTSFESLTNFLFWSL
jgi:hypothetical protein